jgi:hypothetical protein
LAPGAEGLSIFGAPARQVLKVMRAHYDVFDSGNLSLPVDSGDATSWGRTLLAREALLPIIKGTMSVRPSVRLPARGLAARRQRHIVCLSVCLSLSMLACLSSA